MEEVRHAEPTRVSVDGIDVMDGANRGAGRPTTPRTRVASALVAVSLLLLVGCGGTGVTTTSSGSTSASAGNKLCQGIAKVNQSLKKVSSISSSTTVGEVKADQQKLTTALSVLSKLPGGGGSTLSKLESANSQFANAISALPDNAPIGQASQQLQSYEGQVTKAQAGMTKLATTLHCPS